ncbi:MAG: hypothetical protein ABIS92_16375 [Polyangia bacterium]
MTAARPERHHKVKSFLVGALIAAGCGGLGGCGVSRLQTARTVRVGETRVTLAGSYVHNALVGQRGASPTNFPFDLMIRHGATPHLDWGVRTFFGLGLLGDVKWNVLPPDYRTALAVSAGLAFAADPINDVDRGQSRLAKIAHLPLSVTVSRAVVPWFTPYVALGYGNYWIFNYAPRPIEPATTLLPAARSGSGDGVASLHIGVELSRASGRALLLEYGYSRPWGLHDLGDGYSFSPNHLFSIGFHTAGGGQR